MSFSLGGGGGMPHLYVPDNEISNKKLIILNEIEMIIVYGTNLNVMKIIW